MSRITCIGKYNPILMENIIAVVVINRKDEIVAINTFAKNLEIKILHFVIGLAKINSSSPVLLNLAKLV